MLRKLFSCTGGLAAILLLLPQAAALAQSDPYSPPAGGLGTGPYSNSPAHGAEIDRGAPFTDALNALEAKGYASFSNFQQEGGMYSADVVDNGQVKHVLIDPQTGQVSAAGQPQTPPQIQSGAAR